MLESLFPIAAVKHTSLVPGHDANPAHLSIAPLTEVNCGDVSTSMDAVPGLLVPLERAKITRAIWRQLQPEVEAVFSEKTNVAAAWKQAMTDAKAMSFSFRNITLALADVLEVHDCRLVQIQAVQTDVFLLLARF